MREPIKFQAQNGGSISRITVSQVPLLDDLTALISDDGIYRVRLTPDAKPHYFLIRNRIVGGVTESLEEAIEVFCLKD